MKVQSCYKKCPHGSVSITDKLCQIFITFSNPHLHEKDIDVFYDIPQKKEKFPHTRKTILTHDICDVENEKDTQFSVPIKIEASLSYSEPYNIDVSFAKNTTKDYDTLSLLGNISQQETASQPLYFNKDTCDVPDKERAHNQMKVERQIQRMENNNYTINSNVFRSNMSTFGSGASYMRSIHQYSTSHNLNSGLSDTGATIASSIRDTREREKREMADLNDRLASYIEKVRFLEAQNRKLATDLEALRSRWGSDTTSVKMMCESEIKTAHTLIDDSNRQREGLEQEIRRLITELNDMKKKYEEAVLNRQASRQDADALLMKLAEIEAEINLIRRRILVVEDEIARIKRENQRLSGELSCNKTGIETELASRITFENRVKSLLEDCEVLGRQQATEMNELVVQAHRDTTPENREYFKKELSAAIREIRSEYDKISSATRQDMDSWYRKMVIEIQNQSKASSLEQNQAREEIKRHRDSLTEMRRKLSEMEGRNLMLEKQIQELNYALEDEHRSYEAAISDRDASIRKMREDCQALMLELQTLLDTKTSLDAEIAIYRKMMVEEENRGSLRHLIDENIARQDTTVLGGVFESRRVIQTESHASSTGRFIGSATSRITSSSTDH